MNEAPYDPIFDESDDHVQCPHCNHWVRISTGLIMKALRKFRFVAPLNVPDGGELK